MPQLQISLSEENQLVHDLTEEKVTVGRLADNTLAIDDGSISSRHAEIVFEGGSYHLHDLGSTNGTFVNGEQVTDAVLSPGDEVRFGRIPGFFASEEAAGGVSQPLPESAPATVEAASQSSRPSNFASTSPTPKNLRSKDPVATALYALAGVAILVFLGVVGLIFSLQAPV